MEAQLIRVDVNPLTPLALTSTLNDVARQKHSVPRARVTDRITVSDRVQEGKKSSKTYLSATDGQLETEYISREKT